MNPRDRFLKTLNFEKPDDRLPMVEFAPWWGQTFDRWKQEGLPKDMDVNASLEYFQLDAMFGVGAATMAGGCPTAPSEGAGIITNEASYDVIRQHLYTESSIEKMVESATRLRERHARGDVIVEMGFEGYFWFPRRLLGIELHLFAFYDQAALMHRINSELAAFHIRTVNALLPILKPDMAMFAEDMSYNHGPMLSHDLFQEFIAPYYRQVVPHLQRHGIRVFVDSDGDISSMIPWFLDAGIEGLAPLERQAGVDIPRIRREYPRFLMRGGYDKMVMSRGPEAMRAEFERLLPVMKSGGYIPSVDHQTPPGVSLDNYRAYLKLFREYCERAVR